MWRPSAEAGYSLVEVLVATGRAAEEEGEVIAGIGPGAGDAIEHRAAGKRPDRHECDITAGLQHARRDAVMQIMVGARDGGNFSIALAPDGKTLAAAGNNVVALWEVETGKELRPIEGPRNLAGLYGRVDGVARSVPPSSLPIGYSITKADGRKRLTQSQLPSCA